MTTLINSYRYKAFISYRHHPVDQRWAKWLFEELETYRIPQSLQALGYPKQLGQLFRDEEEMRAAASLSEQVETALTASEYLIVICTPRTPQSKWVNEEIRRFRSLGRSNRILILLVEGQPEISFPPALMSFASEGSLDPIAADVRSRRDLSMREVKRLAILKIVAGLIGINVDDLYQRDTRRKRRIFAGVITVLSFLVISFATLSFEIYKNYVLAENQQRSIGITLAEADFREGVRLVSENNPHQALAYLARAIRINGDLASSTLAASLLISGQIPLLLEIRIDDADNAYFSPDERWLAVISGNLAHILDIKTGLPITPPLSHENTISSAQFSADGRWLVTTSWDKTAKIWEVNTGKLVSKPMLHNSEVESASFSPDGKRLLTASWDGSIQLWDMETSQVVFQPIQNDYLANQIGFNADGRLILTISGNVIHVLDAETGLNAFPPFKHDHTIQFAAFSPDSYRLNVVSNEKIINWDLESNQSVPYSISLEDDVEYAQLSSDGLLAVTISGASKIAQVKNATTGTPFSPPIHHKESILYAEFSNDERSLITVTKDHSVHIWDAKTGREVSTPFIHKHFIRSAKFSPSDRRILTISNREIQIWHAKPHPTIPTIVTEQKGIVEENLYSPDKKKKIKISNNVAEIIETSTSNVISASMKHDDSIIYAEFSHNGHSIVTASVDKSARVWDAQTGLPISQPMEHDKLIFSAKFSPDDRWVVTSSVDKTIRVWDAQSGLPVTASIFHDHDIELADFSTDGRWIVVGSQHWEFPNLPQVGIDFSDFLEAIAGYRLNDIGGLEVVPSKPVIELRKQLGETKDLTANGRRFIEWLLDDLEERTVSPQSFQTTKGYIQELIKQNSVKSLNDTLDVIAGHPLALAKLANANLDDLRTPHWIHLALRSDNAAARSFARHVLVKLTMYGSLSGVRLKESHHESLQEQYRGTLKSFDPPAMSEKLHQALILMRGDGVTQDIKQGMTLLKEAASEGEVFARYQLAYTIINIKDSLSEEVYEACKEFIELAETGLPHAQNSLGWCYRNGKITKQEDFAQAIIFYEKAANQGYPWALENMGHVYRDGLGVEKNLSKARRYYRQAAEAGSGSAAAALEKMVEQGKAQGTIFSEATNWYSKAAELGDVKGMLAIAGSYEIGLDLPKSIELAANWYRRAALAGNALAQFKLGTLILENKVHDTETAAYWFNLAAEQGSPAGQFAMGILFETGTGEIARDEKKSQRYYKLVLNNLRHTPPDSLQLEAKKRLEALVAAIPE